VQSSLFTRKEVVFWTVKSQLGVRAKVEHVKLKRVEMALEHAFDVAALNGELYACL
jgi:hypothetical protein